MDLQFWIWLIVIVVTFIARATKKKAQEQQPSEPTSTTRPEFNPKPVTFEELLREIQATKTPEPQASLPPAKTVAYEDYDDDLEEEEKDLERTDYDYQSDDKTFQAYEKAKQEAFVRPSLEDTMKLQDTEIKFGQFKGYQQVGEWVPTTNYAREFQDPESFKKAFIMSEILKRKF
jgi:hypothetical protein